ncbi:hypothetical protein [Natronomonas moolapensis]|uniref:hypothetical protein n=1 Tax=Natronomonas moolapensis TaxID=416273 RepID=UPI000677B7C6|nr:hypothetical protein [Natronomonas moolapensis]
MAAAATIPLAGVAMSWGAPVQARFVDSLSSGEHVSRFGLVRTVSRSLGALGSVVVGTLLDVTGWAVGFGALVALLGAECLLTAALAVRGRQERARSKKG